MLSSGFDLKKRVDALMIKPGPTESGIDPNGNGKIVGGEVIPIDTISAFLSRFWFLFVLLIPLGFLLYKKRSAIAVKFLEILRVI